MGTTTIENWITNGEGRVLRAIGKFLCASALTLAASIAAAAPVTFVDTGTTYRYTVIGDLWGSGGSTWAGVNLATFDNFVAANPVTDWSVGQSAFGNVDTTFPTLPISTFWAPNTDLALQTTFELNGSASGPLTLRVASDNGFLVFLNDQLLAKENAEGYTSYWEYTFVNASSLLVSGTNTLKILAEDHGGLTFFDMQLVGNVPEPGTLSLLGLGLAGLAALRKRRT